MLVLSTIVPPKSIQTDMAAKFPNIDFHYQEDLETDELSHAEVLITYGEDLENQHIRKAPMLKWIMVMSAGLERMPFEAIIERDILVTNARGIHKTPMAEYTFAMVLLHEKKGRLLLENERNEKWDRDVRVGELNGKTMLILGTGAIGGEIARIAKAFNMKTVGLNRSGRQTEYMDRIIQKKAILSELSQADYLISILPSTQETVGFLQAEHFKAMKNSAVFVNIGRGDVVDENILLSALANQEIAHAILDVFDPEPLAKGHPFWNMDNVIVTSHLSSRSYNYLPRAFQIFEQNLSTYLERKSSFINEVDPKKGY
ncbi:D-2-hydroxyacid dehydrogenase [Peribacillus loiseleuriae]|uniref:3-phosphoglycerate dehydrogenase n=1 Tax=Peribacillus loiseleuriae TaxID=1679170 RepID=A0A0K9GQE6_9BACI|nr:D-2-hydroxyacid dehydrogenase [Peribacillus loiseleuriae]KMY48880.1 3-phosphoglycerate dehydrogenase [Peribacillus loiseleuriae]